MGVGLIAILVKAITSGIELFVSRENALWLALWFDRLLYSVEKLYKSDKFRKIYL